MFVGNMTQAPFRNFTIVMPLPGYLRTTVNDELGATKGPVDLPPGKQARVMIMAEAVAPFSDPPAFTVNFDTDASTHSYDLKLPVAPTSFSEPVAVDKAGFMGRWQQLADKEAMEVRWREGGGWLVVEEERGANVEWIDVSNTLRMRPFDRRPTPL